MAQALLEIKNLNVGFNLEEGFAKAICGINLTLEKGKSFGLVGESGCGKSVTAMSVMKLLPSNAGIESGEILYKGENILDFSQKKLQSIRGSKIVLIPQDPLTSLNPLYSIGDQILEVIEQHQKVSKKEAKELAIEALRNVKIPEPEKRFNDYPHEFSGGMRQRAIIAMALCCKPELIIADEPTTALDVTVQAQILNLIGSIQENYDTSLLLITHDLGIIAEVCDDVAIMYAGRIVEQTNVNTIFHNPLHPYTRGLLESLPTAGKTRLKAIDGHPPGITDYISGCQFHPRCSHKMDICEKQEPKLVKMSDSQKVSCYLYS